MDFCPFRVLGVVPGVDHETVKKAFEDKRGNISCGPPTSETKQQKYKLEQAKELLLNDHLSSIFIETSNKMGSLKLAWEKVEESKRKICLGQSCTHKNERFENKTIQTRKTARYTEYKTANEGRQTTIDQAHKAVNCRRCYTEPKQNKTPNRDGSREKSKVKMLESKVRKLQDEHDTLRYRFKSQIKKTDHIKQLFQDAMIAIESQEKKILDQTRLCRKISDDLHILNKKITKYDKEAHYEDSNRKLYRPITSKTCNTRKRLNEVKRDVKSERSFSRPKTAKN